MMDIRWLLGFIEGEGCFCIVIKKSGKTGNSKQVVADFTIKLTESEREVLEKIREYLGGIGHIYFQSSKSSRKKGLTNARDCVAFKVTKLQEAKKIVDLLNDMDFVSNSKKAEFLAWKKCINLMERKEHLTKEGLFKIALLRETIDKRKQWNKKSYCEFRNEIEECSEYRKHKIIPENCNICKEGLK
ncbi:MAG: LAGLIDADG family homing endonuclease [Nanoarchaeota archaeon]|nr:LAGLIDADG family homing endonuclease [Nanoarchaeota archaeon]